MATYYPGSTNQRETMAALYVRGPGNAPCTEPSLHGNMLFVNYPASASSVYTDGLPGSSHMHHSSSELPVPACILSPGPSLGGSALVASRIEEGYASAWGDARNEMAQHFSRPRTADDDIVLGPISHGAQVDLRTQMGILDGQKSLQQPSSVSPMQGQGLSLSLSTQIPVPSLQFQPSNSDTSFVCSHQSSAGNSLPVRDEGIHIEPCPKSLPKFAFPISNSKYLKAAQQLLDEFVNVQKSVKLKTDKSHTSYGPTKVKEGDLEGDEMHKNPQQSTANPAPELSLVDKQSLQNRMTKLLAMLDEVDRRYKQYYHQIQIVVSSFDGVAGCGAAKPYTALALQTISQHFRCLRDAIDGQIRVTSRSLGEEDLSPSSGRRVGISRLRYIDQEIRQRRVFQQFGMMPQHAWRPQRGLPETSVSILRAWLFEHFLHPYPKDSDKLMLARQTGLTRSQVSNWFINARVRLWKPMIEEMYKDEFGGSELDGNLEDKPTGWKENSSSKDGSDMPNLESGSEGRELSDSSKSALAHDVQIDGAAAATGLQRELNSEEMCHMDLRLREPGRPVEDGQLLHRVLARHDEGTRYMAYEMAELGKYGNAAGVSLTLGLQHCHGGLPVSEGHQSFVAVRADGMYNPASLASEMVDYDCLGLADRQQKFSSSQLLHDFVA